MRQWCLTITVDDAVDEDEAVAFLEVVASRARQCRPGQVETRIDARRTPTHWERVNRP